jgi:hypothetical protein
MQNAIGEIENRNGIICQEIATHDFLTKEWKIPNLRMTRSKAMP